MSLRELYQEIIVDHGKHPRHVGKLAEANHSQVGHNPLCGDRLILYVLEKDNVVSDVSFEGSGCAISMASCSLMIEAVLNKSVPDIQHLFSLFHLLVTAGTVSEEDIGKLAVFSGVAEYPARVKCATLCWHTLMAALANENHEVSTEI
jgi:nitrogen fixation protein NifU and related proteins